MSEWRALLAGTLLVLADANSACTSQDCALVATCTPADGPTSTDRPDATPNEARGDAGGNPRGTAPSCRDTLPACGASTNEDCCANAVVPGGAFERSYDGISGDPGFIATVSDFRLDIYEITVGRFRAFLVDYPRNLPAASVGANPNDPNDAGWDPAWNDALPATAAALRDALACDSFATWTDLPNGNEGMPIGCITWYEAFAFCVWDGGRLPTEAEWNYAAAGGDEQRVYPWSSPPTSSAIDNEHAAHGAPASLGVVGSKPKGLARWGQADLAGNVSEWTRDWWRSPYRINPCKDCSEHQEVASERVVRGGSAFDGVGPLRTAARAHSEPTTRTSSIGARCARSR